MPVHEKKAHKTVTSDESELANQNRNPVPILEPGIGTRIGQLADHLGSRRKAAELLGVSADSLQRYIREEHMPPLEVALRLCVLAGESFEWLCYAGKRKPPAPPPPLNMVALEAAVKCVLEIELENNIYYPPDHKAKLIAAIYDYFIDDTEEPTEQSAERAKRLVLRVVK